MPSLRNVRITRQAISPRLAIRTFVNMRRNHRVAGTLVNRLISECPQKNPFAGNRLCRPHCRAILCRPEGNEKIESTKQLPLSFPSSGDYGPILTESLEIQGRQSRRQSPGAAEPDS